MLLLALYCTYCAPTPFLYTLHSSQVIVDRPTQLICISDIYLLSWRWWPLWSIGTFYQWSLQLKKASWVRFFVKISVLYRNCPWKSKKQDKKRAKNHKKEVFLLALLPSFRKRFAPFTEFREWCAPFAEFCKRCTPFAEWSKCSCTICGKAWNVALHIRQGLLCCSIGFWDLSAF